MPAGPSDPLSGLGTRLRRRVLGLGAALHLVDEGANLLGLGPGFDLALGFDAPEFRLLPLALFALPLEAPGARGVGHHHEAEDDVV